MYLDATWKNFALNDLVDYWALGAFLPEAVKEPTVVFSSATGNGFSSEFCSG
jgi:hypothetical protein